MASYLERWVTASFAIGNIGQPPLGGNIAYNIQAMGRLDVQLREIEADLMRLVGSQQDEPGLELTEYLDQSRLWVLDAYELIRTLDECVTKELWNPVPEVASSLKEVKRRLAQPRIPLAKLEPAGQSRGAIPGDLIAESVLIRDVGAGWNIGMDEPVIVARAELSNEVLEFFETARRANPALPPP